MMDLIKIIQDCKDRLLQQTFEIPPTLYAFSKEYISREDLDCMGEYLKGVRLSYYDAGSFFLLKQEFGIKPLTPLSDGWVLLWDRSKGDENGTITTS